MGGVVIRKSCIVVALFVAGVLCLPLAASAQPVGTKASSPDQRYALLAGSCTFEYLLKWKPAPGLGDYPGIGSYGPIPAYEDLMVWYNLLVKDYGWQKDHVKILMNETCTKANMLEEIAALKQYDSPDSLFVIVIVGHGWVQKDAGSLLPGDENSYYSGSRAGLDPWDENFQPYDGIPGGKYVNFITDDELKLLFDDLAFEGRVVLSSASCCGGGLLEDVQRPGLLGLGVGNSDRLEMHWWPVHSLVVLALSGADDLPWYINLDMNPDVNNDGKISVEEAYNWAVAAQESTDPMMIGWGGGPTTLYMFDGIQGETFL